MLQMKIKYIRKLEPEWRHLKIKDIKTLEPEKWVHPKIKYIGKL
jgi:hypothetical protein